MSTATLAATPLTAVPPRDRTMMIVQESVWAKIYGVPARVWAKATDNRITGSVVRAAGGVLGTVRGWLSPLTSRLSTAWQWARARFGMADIGVGFGFAATTYTGREYLFDTIPAKAYSIATFPLRMVWKLLRKVTDRTKRGQRFANTIEARILLVEIWVVGKVQDAHQWLDGQHSSWWMRVVRNATYMALIVKLLSVFSMPLIYSAALTAIAAMGYTSEIDGRTYLNDGETVVEDVKPDSPMLLVWDVALALLGRARAAGIETAAQIPFVPTDNAPTIGGVPGSQSAAEATNKAPSQNGSQNGSQHSQGAANRQQRRSDNRQQQRDQQQHARQRS